MQRPATFVSVIYAVYERIIIGIHNGQTHVVNYLEMKPTNLWFLLLPQTSLDFCPCKAIQSCCMLHMFSIIDCGISLAANVLKGVVHTICNWNLWSFAKLCASCFIMHDMACLKVKPASPHTLANSDTLRWLKDVISKARLATKKENSFFPVGESAFSFFGASGDRTPSLLNWIQNRPSSWGSRNYIQVFSYVIWSLSTLPQMSLHKWLCYR